MSGIDGTLTGMNWAAFTSAEPDLAKSVEERFGAFTHHVLATLRKDGSPRTTGLEVRFLHRDPRFCLQANPGEGQSMGGGDVRISGHAREVTDPGTKAAYGEEVKPPEPFHLFRTELTEVVRTYVEDEKYLVVQVWQPGESVRTLRRT